MSDLTLLLLDPALAGVAQALWGRECSYQHCYSSHRCLQRRRFTSKARQNFSAFIDVVALIIEIAHATQPRIA